MGELPEKQEENRKRRGNPKWKPGHSANPEKMWKPGQFGNPNGRQRNGFCYNDGFFILSVSKKWGQKGKKRATKVP
ncbi:MAG: hypothetical protein HWN68_17100 [Desulfobacterales bacterium]|nr:hypothetical protein [Desulfobacterales bacterium]